MENQNNTVDTEKVETEETEKTGKTYTDDEIALMLQREGDKRIAQYQKTLEKRNKEAEKLKNMSDSERYEYELNEREAKIEAKERELAMAENKAVATSILAEKGINTNLVEFVVCDDAEEMNKRIKLLDKYFKASVRSEVEKRLGGNAPKSSAVETGSLTKETFAKLSLSEKQALYNSDRDLYNSLVN